MSEKPFMLRIGKYQITRIEVILFLSGVMALFTLYCLAWMPPPPFYQRGIFMSLAIILTTLLNPPKSKKGQLVMTVFVLMALVGCTYPMVFEEKILKQLLVASTEEIPIFIIFLIGFSAVLTRISAGRVLLAIMAVMLAYMLWGHFIPGFLGHMPFSLKLITSLLYTDIDLGTFGMFADLACRLLSIFILFATLLIICGLGELSTAVATRVAGNATGGPAKVSVFSSGAYGMLSGNAIANVATTGSFTIPVMKRVGYSPSMAASVEALASTGGYMMPPIMGTAAFVMAEILGIPYLKVCLAAIIPAFLWYFAVFWIVHYYALRQGITKWRPSAEEFMKVIRAKWHLAFALVALIGALFYFVSAEQACFWSVMFMLILANLRKGTRLTKVKMVEFLERFAGMLAPLFLLLICMGITIAALIGAGIHVKLGTLVFGGIEQWWLILLVSGVICIMLGMAIPPTAAYLAVAVIVVPIFGRFGFELLLIHMFIYYLITLAPVTPPVCLASFTAAKIAGSGMMKTGLQATIKGLPLWIIPFAIFKKGLLFGIGTPLSVLAIGVAMLCFGVFLFVLGAEGYFQRRLKLLERILAIGTGLMIVQPVSDFWANIFVIVGVLLIAYWYLPHLYQKLKGKKFQEH